MTEQQAERLIAILERIAEAYNSVTIEEEPKVKNNEESDVVKPRAYKKRIRGRWCAFDTQTGESKTFNTMAEMCNEYGWSPGGDISRDAVQGKLHKGRYFITRL